MNKEETINWLKKEALQFIRFHLDNSNINFIQPEELMRITEECPEEFLDNQIPSFVAPLKYADVVIKNFERNENFYYDKLVRIKA